MVEGGWKKITLAILIAFSPEAKPPIVSRFGENIRLSSDVANPLSRSRNWRADGDGCSACTMQVWRGGGLKGLTVERLEASPSKDR